MARRAAVVAAVEGALERGGGVAAVGLAPRTGGEVAGAAAGGLIHGQQLLLHTGVLDEGKAGGSDAEEGRERAGAPGVACVRAPCAAPPFAG